MRDKEIEKIFRKRKERYDEINKLLRRKKEKDDEINKIISKVGDRKWKRKRNFLVG